MTMNNDYVYVGMCAHHIHTDLEVCEIEEAEENGHMAKIPIYQVFIVNKKENFGVRLWKKIPSQMCAVTYKINVPE